MLELAIKVIRTRAPGNWREKMAGCGRVIRVPVTRTERPILEAMGQYANNYQLIADHVRANLRILSRDVQDIYIIRSATVVRRRIRDVVQRHQKSNYSHK